MNKLYVKDSSIHVVHGKCDRTLVVFPHPVCANRALAWCHKHGLSVGDAALALVHHCLKKGVPTFGRNFGEVWESLAGYKPHKIDLKHLSK